MNEPKPAPASARRVYRAGQFVVMVVECYALAELAWYTANGTHLHDTIGEYAARYWARVQYRAQVLDTLRKIRRLPEL